MAPDFSSDFPASRLTAPLAKDTLDLPQQTQDQIDRIEAMIMCEHSVHQLRSLNKELSLGHRILFHGPSGTGKTLTAAVLGQSTGREVYRIDLSKLMSKYIGETEKNLSRVFDEAEKNGWILFFDEADALFGKRTETRSSHDRYANQEVSYLLQRIDNCSCVIIFATNSRGNIDSAFLRRFQSMVAFALPHKCDQKRL
jgi:SpoVK/Ycf46/Vps4 family AAA+-type ATPase